MFTFIPPVKMLNCPPSLLMEASTLLTTHVRPPCQNLQRRIIRHERHLKMKKKKIQILNQYHVHVTITFTIFTKKKKSLKNNQNFHYVIKGHENPLNTSFWASQIMLANWKILLNITLNNSCKTPKFSQQDFFSPSLFSSSNMNQLQYILMPKSRYEDGISNSYLFLTFLSFLQHPSTLYITGTCHVCADAQSQ